MPLQFTDNQRARLQLQLHRDYTLLVAQGEQPGEIYKILLNRVHYNLSDPSSTLYDLPPEEQYKVYTVLNTLFQASPLYTQIEPLRKINLFVFNLSPIPEQDFIEYRRYRYCPTDDVLFTWLLMNSLLNSYPYPDPGCFGGCDSSNSDTTGEGLAMIIVVILAALALAAAFIAIYYLLSHFLEDMERFWHNEGWLQAAVSMMVTAASGYVVGLLTAYFLAAPITVLAITAGIANPAGLVILGIVCLSLIGAGLGCFITNEIQNYALKKANPNAIDPNDPHRYTLTNNELQNLEIQGFDPEKVLSVIIAIRQQIGKDSLPSLFGRLFTPSGRDKQLLLDKIRQLRCGDIPNGIIDVNVNSGESSSYILRFDVKRTHSYVDAPVEQQPINDDEGHPPFAQQTEFFSVDCGTIGLTPPPPSSSPVPFYFEPDVTTHQPVYNGYQNLPIPSAPYQDEDPSGYRI